MTRLTTIARRAAPLVWLSLSIQMCSSKCCWGGEPDQSSQLVAQRDEFPIRSSILHVSSALPKQPPLLLKRGSDIFELQGGMLGPRKMVELPHSRSRVICNLLYSHDRLFVGHGGDLYSVNCRDRTYSLICTNGSVSQIYGVRRNGELIVKRTVQFAGKFEHSVIGLLEDNERVIIAAGARGSYECDPGTDVLMCAYPDRIEEILLSTSEVLSAISGSFDSILSIGSLRNRSWIFVQGWPPRTGAFVVDQGKMQQLPECNGISTAAGAQEIIVGMVSDDAVEVKGWIEEKWTRVLEISPEAVDLGAIDHEFVQPEITPDGRFVCAVMVAHARDREVGSPDSPSDQVHSREADISVRKIPTESKRTVRNVVIDLKRREFVVLEDYYPAFCWKVP